LSFQTNNRKKELQSFFVFCFLLVATLSFRVSADDESEVRFVSPSQFFQSNPLPENTVTFSSQSAEKIEFKKSDVVELRVKGKVLKAGELYLDDTKIPLVNRNFEFTLKLSFEEKKYRLKFLGSNAFPVMRDFKTRFVNRPQTTINANFLTDDGKVVSKWTGLVGSFPSSEWIEMAWGSEVISNEELKAKELALIKAEEARLALERARAQEIEKALKKAEEEKVAKELARIKAEEAKIALEKAKAQEEEEKTAKELARKKAEEARLALERARAEEMEKTLAKAKEEKAERELAKRKAEEEELARIKEEEEEKARALAKAQAEAEEAKKSQEEEREVASVTNELQEQLPPRIPLGFKFFQGVGAYTLTQTDLGTLSSLHLLLKADFEKDLNEDFLARITTESFLVPLSVSGVSTAPTLIKVGLEWGMKVSIGDNLKLVPSVGFNYQSLLTSGGFGYRDLMGPRLKLEQEYRVSENRVLYGGLSFHFFGSDTAILTPSNYELGIRIYQEWKNFSRFFPSFFVGGEYSRLSLTFSNADLSSSLYSGFLGVSF
jgi:hypothetical protein